MRFDPIEISCFSTADIPADTRYSAWLNWGWPRTSAIYRTDPAEPFDTRWAHTELGEIIFVYTEITSMRWERRVQDIRRSDFDPLIVNMMVKGSAQGQFEDRAFREEAGSFHFHDLARRSIHTSTASRTFSVVVPRPLAIQQFGKLDDLHGLVVRGACADLLLGHAEGVWRALPDLDRSSAPALGRSFLDLLVVAATHVRAGAPSVDTAAARLRQRALPLIDSRLNAPLVLHDLCRELHVSRKSLLAAFRQDGGVQNFIRTTRLEHAKAALADRERNEPIGTIAIRLGFYDAAHLSRLFRARFGMSPRDYRRMLAADTYAQSEPPAAMLDSKSPS